MKNLEIYDELMAEADKLEMKAWDLKSEAIKMHETAKFLRDLVNGNTGFIVDEEGVVIDTESVIPEVTIHRRKRGDGYVVDFGKFGGAFHGFLDGFEGDGAIREAIKVIAKVVYRKAKAYVKTMERPDAAEALPKVDMCA